MDIPTKWMTWAGLAAIVGGLTAIILTAPFATAYFSAYVGSDIPPFWFPWLRSALDPLLNFASCKMVYAVYGRIFNLVYLLFLPATFVLHHLHHSRIEKWGFTILVVGLLATFVGVAGDYWANGAGFLIELLGLLTLTIGATLYGIILLPSRVVPDWCAWFLVACGPGVFVFSFLIRHIPSGPTFPFAIAWLIVGYVLFLRPDVKGS